MAKWTPNFFLQTCSSHSHPCPRKWRHDILSCWSQRFDGALDLPLTLTHPPGQHYHPNISWILLLTSVSPPRPCPCHCHLPAGPPHTGLSLFSLLLCFPLLIPSSYKSQSDLINQIILFLCLKPINGWLSLAYPINVACVNELLPEKPQSCGISKSVFKTCLMLRITWRELVKKLDSQATICRF